MNRYNTNKSNSHQQCLIENDIDLLDSTLDSCWQHINNALQSPSDVVIILALSKYSGRLTNDIYNRWSNTADEYHEDLLAYRQSIEEILRQRNTLRKQNNHQKLIRSILLLKQINTDIQHINNKILKWKLALESIHSIVNFIVILCSCSFD